MVKHLDSREIESLLPTYETVRVWKNRQRVKTILPLFPTYLFVRINGRERGKVLGSPGVIQIVGNGKGFAPLADRDLELLRTGIRNQQVEPYRESVAGQRVRVKSGALQGVEGTLVRKGAGTQFVLTIESIHQHAAIHVAAAMLEPLLD